MNQASLSHLDAFIFDLDGVIWKGNTPIAGAVESVARLREAGKRCLYCTNNSRHTPAEFAATLHALGIECDESEVMTSSQATALYVQSLFTGGCTAYIVGEDGLVQAIRRTGAIVMTSPVVPQRSDMHDNHGAVDCVIVGIDAAFSYHKLRVAMRLITNGARFIATNRDSTFPTPFGLVPGAGTIVAAIETATGISPVTLGKPQPLMAQLLMQKHGLAPERTAMIGDRLDTDIVSAKRANITAIFVATGVHSSDLAARAKDHQKPDAIFTDLPALCENIFASPDEETTVETPTSTVDFASGAAAAAPMAFAEVSEETVSTEAPQHEPAAVLETPFAQEALNEAEIDSTAVETVSELAPETIASNETAFSFNDAAGDTPGSEPEPQASPSEPQAEAETAATPEPFAFDFAASLDDISATPTPDVEPEPEVAAEEVGAEEPEATQEEAPADDKWWETLDGST